jgi:hypothetical protein
VRSFVRAVLHGRQLSRGGGPQAVVAPRRALRVIWLIRARRVRQLLVQRLAVPQATPEKLRPCRYGRHRVRFLGQKAPEGRVMPT